MLIPQRSLACLTLQARLAKQKLLQVPENVIDHRLIPVHALSTLQIFDEVCSF